MKWSEWSTVFLRVGLGVVLLWAGIGKFMAPDGIKGMLGDLGFPVANFMGTALMWFEVIGGVLLILGLLTRVIAWLAVVMFIVTIVTVGPTEMMGGPWGIIIIKDFGLLGAALSLSGTGSHVCSVDKAIKK